MELRNFQIGTKRINPKAIQINGAHSQQASTIFYWGIFRSIGVINVFVERFGRSLRGLIDLSCTRRLHSQFFGCPLNVGQNKLFHSSELQLKYFNFLVYFSHCCSVSCLSNKKTFSWFKNNWITMQQQSIFSPIIYL